MSHAFPRDVRWDRIAIGWEGLPPYAAASINSIRNTLGVTILGTPASAAFARADIDPDNNIKWIDRNDEVTWRDLGIETPDIFVHTGWAYPHWNSLANEVLARGGQLVSMVDNRWKGSLRQWLGSIYFRITLRSRFSCVWVPGLSGRRLMRHFGMPADRVFAGLYGADTSQFFGGRPLRERPLQILFSGQLIRRKGIDILREAWIRFRRNNGSWRLVVCGVGPEGEHMKGVEGIDHIGFVSPTQLAEIMKESRYLVLPSRDEHWGVVVHEAACCGCGLLLSESVGSGEDLLGPNNGSWSKTASVGSLLSSLVWAAGRPPSELEFVEIESRRRSLAFGPKLWAENLELIVSKVASNHNRYR